MLLQVSPTLLTKLAKLTDKQRLKLEKDLDGDYVLQSGQGSE